MLTLVGGASDDMYDYIFNRYQHGYTALMGAMSTFRSRSILRELGKVYGLPKSEIDRLVHEPEHMLNKNEVTNTILSVYNRMADFPNQRSSTPPECLFRNSHWSVIVRSTIRRKDCRPCSLICMSPKKSDLKNSISYPNAVSVILKTAGRSCMPIRASRLIPVSQNVFSKTPISPSSCARPIPSVVFYIESPAMRQLLTKLHCDDYLTLVAASSIIRPGVSSSGMMAAFIQRHHDPSQVVYPHPVFKEQLEETYGVMVYQEDVMKIANAYGGLDMADADVLRRMMSGKYRSKDLIEIEGKYFDNCRAKGYDEKVSREIWRQMESFAGYSFNKAHSASFAVESYQSLYLKTYFPLEFMVSVLNNYGGFYNRKVYVNEARVAGATICLPCINRSEYQTSIHGSDIYLGFDCMQHVESKQVERLIEERTRNGLYQNLEQFIKRTGTGLEQLIILIRIGAFRSFGSSKKELLWEAHLLLNKHTKASPSAELFESNSRKPVLPPLDSHILEDYYDEMELIGFCVSGTLFDLARSDFRGDVQSRELMDHVGPDRSYGRRFCGRKVCEDKAWRADEIRALPGYRRQVFRCRTFPTHVGAISFKRSRHLSYRREGRAGVWLSVTGSDPLCQDAS